MGWPPNLAGRAERPSALTVSIVNKMHFKILPAKCSPFCSVINWTKLNITVMSHKQHCLSNHWHMGCLFNSLFRPTTQKTSKLPIGEGNSLMFSGFCSMDSPHKWTVLWKVFPCYGIIMKKHPLFPRTHPYSRYAPPPGPGRCPWCWPRSTWWWACCTAAAWTPSLDPDSGWPAPDAGGPLRQIVEGATLGILSRALEINMMTSSLTHWLLGNLNEILDM